MATDQDPFQEGLAFEEELGLRWQPRQGLPEAGEQAHLNEQNEHTLKILDSLEGYHPELTDNASEEILHLDHKLNVILDLVGQLVARDMPLPDPVPVRLGAHGASWVQPVVGPSSGQPGMVELYLNPSYPKALELPSEVVSVEGHDQGQRITVAFQGMGETLQEGLERLVFRRHRRSIARARHG